MRGRWGAIAVAACLVAVSQAQSTIPSCATTCMQQFVPKSGCDATDFGCICSNEALMSNIETCTLSSCSVIEGLAAKNATATACGDEVRDITEITPIVTAVFGVLALLSVGMRLYQCIPQKEVQGADICAAISMALAIPMGILEFLMSARGFGKDIWTLTPDAISQVVQWTWLTEIFYFAALGFTKSTVLLFYLRVFPQASLRNACVITICVVAAFTIASVFATIFHCWPIEYGWESWKQDSEGSCFDFKAFVWAHASISIALDVWILAIPLPTLAGLQLGTRKKASLIIMFSVGIFITIVSCVRLKSFSTFSNTTNPTYDNVATAYWSVLEAFVSVICCCLPAVRAVLRTVFPACFGTTDNDSHPPSYHLSGQSGMPSAGGIKKSVTHNITFQQRSNESDTFELVDKNDGLQDGDYRHGWA